MSSHRRPTTVEKARLLNGQGGKCRHCRQDLDVHSAVVAEDWAPGFLVAYVAHPECESKAKAREREARLLEREIQRAAKHARAR